MPFQDPRHKEYADTTWAAMIAAADRQGEVPLLAISHTLDPEDDDYPTLMMAPCVEEGDLVPILEDLLQRVRVRLSTRRILKLVDEFPPKKGA